MIAIFVRRSSLTTQRLGDRYRLNSVSIVGGYRRVPLTDFDKRSGLSMHDHANPNGRKTMDKIAQMLRFSLARSGGIE
jgi:hypothetical protein